MKHLFFAFLILLHLNSYAQYQVIQVDDLLQASLPISHEITDTLSQTVITAEIDNGRIVITRTPDPLNPTIKTENDLKEFYQGSVEGLAKALAGKVLDVDFEQRQGLVVCRATMRHEIEGQIQLQELEIVRVRDVVYTAQFWQLESMLKDMKAEKDSFFSSIKFSGKLKQNDQNSTKTGYSTAYNIGYVIGRILSILLLLTGLFFLIRWIIKKNKQ